MALTLTQAEYYSQNMLVKGVIDTIIKESPILGRLPFVNVIGNALAMNREDASNPPTVNFRQVNGVWTESTGKVTPETAVLKILGGDADVDNFLQRTRSDVNDLMAVQVGMKSKAMAHEFEDAFIYGVASGSNSFNGLHTLVPAAQTVDLGTTATGAPLTMIALDEMCDLVLGGKPDMILMNKNIRRRLSAKLRGVGSYMTQRDDYGNLWMMWQEIPILVTDFIGQVETLETSTYKQKDGGATSSIFAIRFGEGDGMVGIQNGGIETQVWEKLETKDASRTRLRWYVGTALYSEAAVARITGVTDAAMA